MIIICGYLVMPPSTVKTIVVSEQKKAMLLTHPVLTAKKFLHLKKKFPDLFLNNQDPNMIVKFTSCSM